MQIAQKFALWSVPAFLLVGVLLVGLDRQFVTSDAEGVAMERNAAVGQTLALATWSRYQELLGPDRVSAHRLEEIATLVDLFLTHHFKDTAGFKVRIYSLDGAMVYSSDRTELTTTGIEPGRVGASANGEVVSRVRFYESFRMGDRVLADVYLVETLLPIYEPGSQRIYGVFELLTDVSPQMHSMASPFDPYGLDGFAGTSGLVYDSVFFVHSAASRSPCICASRMTFVM